MWFEIEKSSTIIAPYGDWTGQNVRFYLVGLTKHLLTPMTHQPTEDENTKRRMKTKEEINELKKERAIHLLSKPDHRVRTWGWQKHRFYFRCKNKLKEQRMRLKYWGKTREIEIEILMLQLYHLYLLYRP